MSIKYTYPDKSAGGGAGGCEAEHRHLVTLAELRQRKRLCPLGEGIAASSIMPRSGCSVTRNQMFTAGQGVGRTSLSGYGSGLTVLRLLVHIVESPGLDGWL